MFWGKCPEQVRPMSGFDLDDFVSIPGIFIDGNWTNMNEKTISSIRLSIWMNKHKMAQANIGQENRGTEQKFQFSVPKTK